MVGSNETLGSNLQSKDPREHKKVCRMNTRMSTKTRPTITSKVHHLLRPRLQPGDIAVDATLGNGHDYEFLRNQLGPTGTVYGIDLQPEALDATRRRLDLTPATERPALILGSHHDLPALLPAEIHGHIAAILFNLGYLPGGDKTIITRAETTLPALQSALGLLRPGGVLSVVLYPGHPGGEIEANEVLSWAQPLARQDVAVFQLKGYNALQSAPFHLHFEKI